MTTIQFFPIIAGLEKIEPVILAKDYNKTIPFEKEEFSIKTCPGVRDLTSLGYIIPLWQDILLRFNHNTGIEVVPSGDMVDHAGNMFFDVQFHEERSLAGYSFGDEYVKFVMKIRCPWYIKTTKGTSVLMLPVQYADNPPFIVAPGIINTHEYPMILAQVILKKFHGDLILRKGTPLCQLIAVNEQPQILIHKDDSAIKKNINLIKNWMYSKMHSVVQYRNLGKILK